MKARLLIGAVCLMLLLSAVESNSSTASFSTALAGHTTSGGICNGCIGMVGCIPDERDECWQGVTKAPPDTVPPVDFGAPLLLVVAAGFACLRLRAVL